MASVTKEQKPTTSEEAESKVLNVLAETLMVVPFFISALQDLPPAENLSVSKDISYL